MQSIKPNDIFSFDFTLGYKQQVPTAKYSIKIIYKFKTEPEYLVECVENNSMFVIGYRDDKANEEGVSICKDSRLNNHTVLRQLNERFLTTKSSVLIKLKVPAGFRYYMHQDKLEKFFNSHRKDIFIDLEERLSILDI